MRLDFCTSSRECVITSFMADLSRQQPAKDLSFCIKNILMMDSSSSHNEPKSNTTRKKYYNLDLQERDPTYFTSPGKSY